MALAVDDADFQKLMAVAKRVVDSGLAEGIDALSYRDAVFFLVWIADGEVGNGGMNAVCYNSTGDYLSRVPDAFRTVGAPNKAALFEELIELFGPGAPSPDWETRYRQFQALPESTDERFEALDERYYAVVGEDVDELLLAWVE